VLPSGGEAKYLSDCPRITKGKFLEIVRNIMFEDIELVKNITISNELCEQDLAAFIYNSFRCVWSDSSFQCL